MTGHAQCAHCGALLHSEICSICAKSIHDPVAVVDTTPNRRGLSDESRRQLRGFAVVVMSLAVVGAGAYYVLTREEVEATPTALAVPVTTTTIDAPIDDAPVVTRPNADAAPLPTLPLSDAAERDVGDGTNPWNGAPPRNVLTGELLENTDYGPGIAAIADLLGDAPSGFEFGPPAEAEWNDVDLAAAESSQPFAARSVADDTGPIADLWLFARGSSTTDGSAAFLDAARARWPIDEPIDSFAPRPGIRLHQIVAFGGETLWVDVRDRWMILYLAPVDVDTALLGAISEDWG
ncbi:MAG: hypothetical protein AAF081_04970 [Actinomycetota bacterium]